MSRCTCETCQDATRFEKMAFEAERRIKADYLKEKRKKDRHGKK